ncbi:LuxR C-terminal-related transcriptional regulator [Sporosarcina ureae]|uniref:LuxR C-terminal-related transcriptional regulator n=1 Tax=Sporosarcina ureae TaxID=1571 RepID=UPI0009DC6F43|nr:LuxR C-terminal-related transcriptional regulator [Sporosarcina ureae]ARF17544.1 hypothetical protein SporoP17a_09815 [Sporosarcina ureae]
MNVHGANGKVKMPIANKEIISRKDIEIPIHAGLVRLTIVRAPVGYGKTMLLSKKFSEITDSTAWLTLDEMDNDPVRFWNHVIMSIEKSGNTIRADRLLRFIKTSPPYSMIIDMLLNELSSQTTKITLVLDDYHMVTNPVIHKMMNQFIDYLPHYVKIFITSKDEVPLTISKWRPKGWIYEIGIQQLQFQLDEVREFYQKRSPQSSHSKLFYQQVLRITEGWPLGIQLLNMTGSEEVLQWEAKDFSISSPVVTNYLLYEVFSRLSPSMQEFLMRTSVLKDVTPESCNQVLNRNDSGEVLRDMEEEGVFTNQLRDNQLTYRYHDLFLMVLRNEMHHRFSQDSVTKIYAKAAHVQYKQGDYATAIELAIKGKLLDVANHWIEENLVNIFVSKQNEMFMRWIMMLRKHSFELHAETLAIYAFNLAIRFEMDKAESVIRELDRRNEKTNWKDEDSLKDASLILDIVKAFTLFRDQGCTKKKVTHLQKVIHVHPFPANSRWKNVSIIYNHFEPQLLRTSLGNKGNLISIKQLSTLNDILQNDTFLAHNLSRYSHGLQAEVLYEMNLLHESEQYSKKALEYTYHYNDVGLSIPMYVLQAKIFLANEQFTEAQAILNHAMESAAHPNWQCILVTMKALSYIREGDLERAECELNKSSNLTHQQTESGLEFWMLVQARLHIAKGNTRKALNYIEQVSQEAQEKSQMTIIMETKVLRSICMWKNNKKKLAIDILHEALELAVKSGYKRMFLEEKSLNPVVMSYIKSRMNFEQPQWKTVPLVFAQSLQKDHTDHPVATHHNSKPNLTPREEELIKALATGASNKEIAEQLFLSVGTVRVYLSKIYKKLHVSSRTQAVLQAKDWR